jgi:hypothetical protein
MDDTESFPMSSFDFGGLLVTLFNFGMISYGILAPKSRILELFL